ncbi:MAG TPA: hypothetical protein DEO32_03485 [Ruminococcaceae bacterium]|nr:hypothetical protein [Oscillospiraceae bacterium]
MPYINVKTNAKLSDEKKEAIGSRLSEVISILPGKSYHYLMTAVEDNVSMMFRRETIYNIAMVEVKIFGKSTRDAYEKLTAAICDIMRDEAGVDGKYCYVKFTEVEHWGYDGSLF